MIRAQLPKKRERQTYFSQRYQAKKEWYQQQYRQKKAEKEEQEKETLNSLYQARNVKILMSLKEYTELNLDKRKIWLDFVWTLQECQQGISAIEEVMKLRETAENLIKDYRETAIKEARISGKNWTKLSQKQQDKLIKFWAQERVRKDQELTKQLTELETQGNTYQTELELAKFHEERGKVGCECWQCSQEKQLSQETERKLFSGQEEKIQLVKSECANCYEFKKVDSETGLCAKCAKE